MKQFIQQLNETLKQQSQTIFQNKERYKLLNRSLKQQSELHQK